MTVTLIYCQPSLLRQYCRQIQKAMCLTLLDFLGWVIESVIIKTEGNLEENKTQNKCSSLSALFLMEVNEFNLTAV